jgi:hypothetical protein
MIINALYVIAGMVTLVALAALLVAWDDLADAHHARQRRRARMVATGRLTPPARPAWADLARDEHGAWLTRTRTALDELQGMPMRVTAQRLDRLDTWA